MRTITHVRWRLILSLSTNFAVSAMAQEVTIPDPGLNAAIRETLQKPAGPLTAQDLLSLTNLNAGNRNVRSIAGLEAARNLAGLHLDSNSFTNFALPSALTNLVTLDLSFNPLTNFALASGFPKLETLDLFSGHLTSFVLPGALPKLNLLNLGFNSLSQCSLPSGLTNLDTLFLEGNQLTNFTLPAGLTALTFLDLAANGLTRFSFPADMTNLRSVLIFANQLTNVTLPATLTRLGSLDLDFNHLRSLTLPGGLTNLIRLNLFGNQLTNLSLPPGIARLNFLDVGDNQLISITLPASLNNLDFLRLSGNRLTSLAFPPGMTNLSAMFLRSNQLTSLTLPSGLTHLVQIDVMGNQLTNLTLAPDMTQLVTLGLEGNPLTTLVVSEPVAATNLAGTVSLLRNQGVSVFTYPLTPQLVQLLMAAGAFKFGITGPPGVYTVLGSTNLASWSVVGVATNPLGGVNFHDVTANTSLRKFYRVRLQVPPANMVFIPPNTFTMGSPTNELHHQPNEGPQTTVTLTRGFWIGKYEVTQEEYLSVTGTNPSQFPGDLTRPVSSVSWPDATNYCWKLTQRELAAGRISAGSEYRLPTEAEWECAARAGTTTRFSYGDDPDYASLANYAWQSLDDGLTVHPVGHKLPNPWGLYDMAGNVFEWCQDWLGPLPGGFVTDPRGPPSNPIGEKIMRGGAFDVGGPACRSASRMSSGNHPALTDWNLGFRVVLVAGL